MELETVNLEWLSPEVAQITLNRPKAGNSLSSQLVADLLAATREVRYSKETKVLLVTGAGQFFCAGAGPEGEGQAGIVDLGRAAIVR